MSKHTPGPWKKSGRGIKAATRMICLQAIADEECDANARLISAAPDMLEALKAIHDKESTLNRSKVRAAIDKAEGRDK